MSFLQSSFNPFVTNGFSHPYTLDESISIYRGIESEFSFLFDFSMKFVSANRIAPRFVFGLPMSHKTNAMLI